MLTLLVSLPQRGSFRFPGHGNRRKVGSDTPSLRLLLEATHGHAHCGTQKDAWRKVAPGVVPSAAFTLPSWQSGLDLLPGRIPHVESGPPWITLVLYDHVKNEFSAQRPSQRFSCHPVLLVSLHHRAAPAFQCLRTASPLRQALYTPRCRFTEFAHELVQDVLVQIAPQKAHVRIHHRGPQHRTAVLVVFVA